jgi:hypothetical protein
MSPTDSRSPRPPPDPEGLPGRSLRPVAREGHPRGVEEHGQELELMLSDKDGDTFVALWSRGD